MDTTSGPSGPRQRGVVVARVGELRPGETKKFLIPGPTGAAEAFLVNFEGRYSAYVNRCRHIPMTLDWVENRFFTEDGRYLQCATHGAWYDPASGLCVAGPPAGKALIRVPLEIRGAEIVAYPPAEGSVPRD